MEENTSTWQTLYSSPITINTLDSKRTLVKAIRLQQVKWENGYVGHFVDISEFMNNKLTEHNVYLKPHEFEFLVKKLRDSVTEGWISMFGRTLHLHSDNDELRINLRTSTKEREVTLNKDETDIILERYDAILQEMLMKIKEERDTPAVTVSKTSSKQKTPSSQQSDEESTSRDKKKIKK